MKCKCDPRPVFFKKRTNKTKYKVDTKGPPLQFNSIRDGWLLNKRLAYNYNLDAKPKGT